VCFRFEKWHSLNQRLYNRQKILYFDTEFKGKSQFWQHLPLFEENIQNLQNSNPGGLTKLGNFGDREVSTILTQYFVH
jgi:hypothetical protein